MFKKPVENFHRDCRGSFLVYALIIIMVLTVLGAVLISLSLNNYNMGLIDRDYQAVYYIAEAGITYCRSAIEDKVLELYKDSSSADSFFSYLESYFDNNYPKTVEIFDENFGKQPSATVAITGRRSLGENSATYTLISSGTLGDTSRRAVTQMNIQWKSGGDVAPFDKAVFADSFIFMEGSAEIHGPVGTNAVEENSIDLKWSNLIIYGNLSLGPGADKEKVILSPRPNVDDHVMGGIIDNLDFIREYPPPELPEFPSFPQLPVEWIELNQWNKHKVIDEAGNLLINNYLADGYTLNLNRNAYFPRILLESNWKLNINLGGMDREIVVDRLEIKQGHINIIGPGKLTIYINDIYTLTNGSTVNNNGDEKDLDIYYKGTSTLNFAGNTRSVGSLFVDNADIFLGGSGVVTGHIVSGGSKVQITGGSSANTRVLYAPNAEVALLNGAQLTGSVIAKTFKATGNTRVYYRQIDDDNDLPIGGETGPDISIEEIMTIGPIKED